MSLLRLLLIVVVFGWRPGSAEENADFIAISILYPGGIEWYVAWDSQNANLTHKSVDILKAAAIDPKQLGEGDRHLLAKQSTSQCFNEIASLIRQLPDQRTLPDDGRRVFDGYGIELSVKVNGTWTKIYYNNPDEHLRIMDAACVGIVTRIENLVKDVKSEPK
jgi:hypothetical protein